jgi:hypothetical protein
VDRVELGGSLARGWYGGVLNPREVMGRLKECFLSEVGMRAVICITGMKGRGMVK